MDGAEKKRPAAARKGSVSATGSLAKRPGEDTADAILGENKTEIFSVTSGDEETDREIDLAVETLFVEEPEAAPPETTEVEATIVRQQVSELDHGVRKTARPQRPSDELDDISLDGLETAMEPGGPSGAGGGEFDLALDMGLDAFKDTEFDGPRAKERRAPSRPAPSQVTPKPAKPKEISDAALLRKLEEAILTLEWEISKRSVAVLANELKKVRSKFQDNVTVDFAALAMRVVLDYIVKRMSRAHPESIRFLLEVTDYLKGALNASEQDPLTAFDRILRRYERYKSAVRRAEGIPDVRPAILGDLEINDPQAFYELVTAQAATLARAGESLARGIGSTEAPENLIRSFRFLATRSFNRILDGTKRKRAASSSLKGRGPKR